MRFFLIQLILTLLLLVLQLFLFRKFRKHEAVHGRTGSRTRIATVAFILFNLPLVIAPLLRLARYTVPAWVSTGLMPPVYLWHFISVLLGALLLLGKLLKLPFFTAEWILQRFDRTKPMVTAFKTNESVRRFDAGRRRAVRSSLALIAGGAAIASAREIYREDTFTTTDIRIDVKDLPPSFESFSIGFLSDIHSGIFMSPERMRGYAEAVNGLGADMIVVTGDFVNASLEEAPPLREAFAILSAPHGVYGVLGNHDFYTRKADEVTAEIEKTGMTLLRNRSLTLERRGEILHLSGIDDTGNPGTAARAFRSVVSADRRPSPRILLCHRPYFFPDAAAAGFDLVLSGHTHGGQVVLGDIGKDVLAPARLVSPYVAGLYREGTSRLYVSRGIGTVGVPFRFNCPPEITRVVLTRANPA